MRLDIIIINFRTPAYTIDCLASIAAERATLPGLRVLLVENHSGDDSRERIAAAIAENQWTPWVHLLVQDRNLGFAGGNNAAIRHALDHPDTPDYLLLLNSDTLVHPGCLAAGLDRMARSPDIGILSAMLRNRDGSVQNVCRRLGGMDESFFFYGEDIEFCHRMWKNGLRVFFDPAGAITHFGGGSSDATRLHNRRKEILIWRARFHVQRVCYGPLAAAWLRLLYILVFTAKVAGYALTGRWRDERMRGAWSGWTVLTRPLKVPP